MQQETMAPARSNLSRAARLDPADRIKHGVIGGIIAGLVFAMFEMVMAALLNGGQAFFMPLRMIGAIGIGVEALNPTYSLLTAGATGVIIHMVLSMIYGVVLAMVVTSSSSLGNTKAIVAVATIAGLLLWVVNFYVVAPIAGWDWFPQQTNAVVQFVAHTFMFGSVLGFYLGKTIARP